MSYLTGEIYIKLDPTKPGNIMIVDEDCYCCEYPDETILGSYSPHEKVTLADLSEKVGDVVIPNKVFIMINNPDNFEEVNMLTQFTAGLLGQGGNPKYNRFGPCIFIEPVHYELFNFIWNNCTEEIYKFDAEDKDGIIRVVSVEYDEDNDIFKFNYTGTPFRYVICRYDRAYDVYSIGVFHAGMDKYVEPTDYAKNTVLVIFDKMKKLVENPDTDLS